MLRTRIMSDRRRSRFDIIVEILRDLRDPICWTNIIAHCNMSTKQSKQYLSLLTSKDLVHIQRAAGKVTYQRTETGGEFLKQYDKMAMLFGPSISAPSLT